MKIKVIIEDTEPLAKEGTYVFNSGELADTSVSRLTEEIETFVLCALNEMRVVRVNVGGVPQSPR
jgi:hypothetical protein